MTSLISALFLEMFSISPGALSLWHDFHAEEDNHQPMACAISIPPNLGRWYCGAFSPPEAPSVTAMWPPSLAWVVPHVLMFFPELTSKQPSHWGRKTGPVDECLSCLEPWTQAIGQHVHIPALQSVLKGWDAPVKLVL